MRERERERNFIACGKSVESGRVVGRRNIITDPNK